MHSQNKLSLAVHSKLITPWQSSQHELDSRSKTLFIQSNSFFDLTFYNFKFIDILKNKVYD